jgi:hypothetical protein
MANSESPSSRARRCRARAAAGEGGPICSAVSCASSSRWRSPGYEAGAALLIERQQAEQELEQLETVTIESEVALARTALAAARGTLQDWPSILLDPHRTR